MAAFDSVAALLRLAHRPGDTGGPPSQTARLVWRTLRIIGGVLAVVGVVGLLIFAIAHIPPPVTHGTVIGKQDIPAHSERYQSGSLCMSYDKQGTCTYSIPQYSERWVTEEWELNLKDCTASPKPDGTVECRTGWLNVDEATYEATQLNTFYGEKP